jgi:aldehyde dehydrogenase (NAD+)
MLPMGGSDDPNSVLGPLISEKQRQRVAGIVNDGVAAGAKVITGGKPMDRRGYFYEATIITNTTPDMRLIREEIFGPVGSVIPFDDEDEAIAAANDTEFGLVSYVFTGDVKRALRVCERLETGMVGLNQGLVSNAGAPFGGVKASGLGREGGTEGILEYLETKYVAINV